jgi:Arm DNA-binding domain
MGSRDFRETQPRPEEDLPIPTISLTDLSVRHLKPMEGKRITYLDKSLKGFGVMVMPSGHASFVLTYGPDRKRIKLGDVGVVRLADARAQARQRLSRYQLGQEKETGSPIFKDAVDEFLAASRRRTKPGRRAITAVSLPVISPYGTSSRSTNSAHKTSNGE